jgi:hypothetical protein
MLLKLAKISIHSGMVCGIIDLAETNHLVGQVLIRRRQDQRGRYTFELEHGERRHY